MIKAIFSVALDGHGLGYKGKLLFRDSEDLKHFKKTTEGGIVVMGRKTFEECGVLPNRLNAVLSSSLKQTSKNLVIFRAIDTLVQFCIQKAKEGEDVWIIGGGELLNYFFQFNLIEEVVVSHFQEHKESDVFLPVGWGERFALVDMQMSKNKKFALKRLRNMLP